MANFIETRGMLSKLLATENLIIEHDSNSKTASFDTQNRVLKLPVLNTDSEHVYNMFCAHEVGHALQTPVNWRDDAPKGVPFDFINVVEDVRIEKYIQSKFPGLRVDFSKGYDKLNADDFFQIRDTDVSKMSLIDRINLHFKLGARALIPFTTEEQVYVTAVDEADTWQKVLLASQLIYDYIGKTDGDDFDDINGKESETKGEANAQSDESSMPGGSNSNVGDDEGDELGDESNNTKPDPSVSQTQRALDESLKDMANNGGYHDHYIYAKLGDVNLDDIIISIDTIRETTVMPSMSYAEGIAEEERNEMNTFLKSIKGDVNHMVQQFEMKKSADAYARQQTNKTGVLDTNRLHNYKLTDDVFLRQSVTPDGKCHGMVMYLDWSGSMCDICFDTVKQIITLVQFCRKVQIPFDVYLFTTGESDYTHEDKLELNKTLAHGAARLIQVLTSDAKKKQIDNDMFNLWCAGKMCQFSYNGHLPFSQYLMMGGTPLNNALMIVPELIKQFRVKTGAQKVSFVCLTDGESAPLCYYEKVRRYDEGEKVRIAYPYYETMMVRSGSSVFPIESRNTGDVINWLKTQVSDVYISNLFLGKQAKSSYHLSSYGARLNEKMFRKNGSYVTTSDSWPIIGVINPNSFKDTTDTIDIEAGSSKSKIKSALGKMLKTKQSSRLILTELVGQFA